MEPGESEESRSLSYASSDEEETEASPNPRGRTNILNEQYEQRVRGKIDLINSLLSLGVEQDLALPAIAVIGDQSSGKSSVLEALSGVALPRGSGIVTRCPLALKMMKTNANNNYWYGKIKYKSEEKEIEDPSQVEEFIQKAQDEIAGVGVGISHELINLEISSPDVPDLTLIDLPGIARVAVNGQPDDIGEQIKNLINTFITKQETINLVVVPCNVDIATTEALKMAQEVDPNGERTLGILTKPDLVDRGTEETVVQIIRNKIIPLAKGYMVVKCRGQKDITDKVSLTEALEKEKAFFEGHRHFGILWEEGYAGIHKLGEKLTLELEKHIEKSLPQLQEQINIKIAEIQKELEKYGKGPPADAEERSSFLTDMLNKFTEDIKNLSIGEELKYVNLLSMLRNMFKDWKELIDHHGLKFNNRIEEEEYQNKYRGRELPGFLSYKIFEEMMRDHIKELKEPALKKLKEASDTVRKAFVERSQKRFTGYPNLFRIAKDKIEKITQSQAYTAESLVKTEFKMEKIIYTQDKRYTDSVEWVRVQQGISQAIYIVATLDNLQWHFKSYYHVASQRMADRIPLVIRYQILKKATKQLRREMTQLLENKDIDLLEEDPDIVTKRNKLASKLNRLKEAQNKVQSF